MMILLKLLVIVQFFFIFFFGYQKIEDTFGKLQQLQRHDTVSNSQILFDYSERERERERNDETSSTLSDFTIV